MRPARFRSGSRQPLPAEGLYTHDRADLIAIDVCIAGMDVFADEIRSVFDAAVDAKRQAIAGGINRLADIRQPVAGKAHDMEDRSENLALQYRNGIDFKRMRREKRPVLVFWPNIQFAEQLRLRRHPDCVFFETLARILVDHWSDIGIEAERIAE